MYSLQKCSYKLTKLNRLYSGILSLIISYISLENKKEAEHLYLFHCKIQTSIKGNQLNKLNEFFCVFYYLKEYLCLPKGGLMHNKNFKKKTNFTSLLVGCGFKPVLYLTAMTNVRHN